MLSEGGAHRARWWALSSLACAAVMWAASALGPGLALDVRVAFSLAFLAVSAEILLVSRLVPTPAPAKVAIATVLCLAGLFALRGAPVVAWSAATLTVLLLLSSTLLGGALGSRIERPGHLLAVAAISAVADLWSVYDPRGVSAQMAKQVAEQPDQLALFALPWPMLGTRRIEAIIGAGDILFAALYLSAFERHGLRVRRCLIALASAFVLGLLALLITERPVPLLPLLGLAVIASDPATRSLPPQEKRTVMVVLALLCGLLLVRFLR